MPKKINWFLISENYGANLFPFGFHFPADYFGWKKVFGRGCAYQSVGTANGFLHQAYGLEAYNAMANFFFKKFCADKNFTKHVLNNANRISKEFYQYNLTLKKTDFSLLTNKQLAQKFRKFYQYFYQMSTWSVPFSYTEYGTPLWTNALTKYLNTLKIPKKYTTLEIFQILSANQKKTYTAKEKESILALASEVKKSAKLSRIFKKSPTEIISQLAKYQQLFLNKIKNHEKKYNWINFAFEGPLLDLAYFVTVIKDWVASKNPQQELSNIKHDLRTLTFRQKRLIRELKIDAPHQWMFWVVKEFGFHKTFRKDIEYYSYYVYDTFLLKELGKRIGATVNQGHYLTIDEITGILAGKKEVNLNELNERIKRNFYVIDNGKIKLLTGKKAWDFDKNIKSRPIPKGLKSLSGQCASRGKVQGTVKIIKNKEDYAKFKAGDILVSYATNPNMVPLMKKSAAVVTDEGGVTCHAAIVSRELNIPCVIGTRFATKVLKDGQKVEVDATKGIVRKI